MKLCSSSSALVLSLHVSVKDYSSALQQCCVLLSLLNCIELKRLSKDPTAWRVISNELAEAR